MIDLPDTFRTHAVSLGWVFSYGNKANQNLLRSDSVVGRIYLLMDPVLESEAPSEFGGDGLLTYSGSFMLMVKSNLDNTYGEQKGNAAADAKYDKNIKPIKQTELPKLKKLIDCSDLTRNVWSVLEGINEFDANLDGVIVTYSLTNID